MYTKITISFQKQIGNFVPSMEMLAFIQRVLCMHIVYKGLLEVC